MNRVRKAKLNMLGAVALSSTVIAGTAAVAAGSGGFLPLLKGISSVRWSDVISVLALVTTPASSSKLTLKSVKFTKSPTLGGATPVNSGSPATGAAGTKLGMNLTTPAYYEGNRAFMNLLAGGQWGFVDSQGKWGDAPLDRLDSNQRFVDLRAGERGIRQISHPTASYRGQSVDIVCRWSGTGSVTADGPHVKNLRVDGKSLSYTYMPIERTGMWLTIHSSSSSDPIRAMDCREKDADPNAVFEPTYLAETGRYNALRFMKWSYGGVESNKPVTWATRTKPSHDVILGQDGIAIEYMIQLANLQKADPWFSIPWNADADYVRQFAELVKAQLDPSLKAYVEVSNEVWNYVYPVTGQARDEGKAAGLSTNDHEAMLLRYSQKTGEVMDVWSSVFAGQMNRTVRVIAIQNSKWSAEVVLGFGDTAKKVDAIATAPYFHATLEPNGLATPAAVDGVFRELETTMNAVLDESKKVKEFAATTYGIRHITYEAGQHVMGATPLAQMQALQDDPRMAALYTKYLTRWREQFGELMMLFSDYGKVSQWGSWGQREYVGQPLSEAPKENAVELFRASYVKR